MPFRKVFEFESDLSTDVLHGVIVGHDVSANEAQFFIAANLNQAFEQFRAEAFLLRLVTDQQREFGFTGAVQLA